MASYPKIPKVNNLPMVDEDTGFVGVNNRLSPDKLPPKVCAGAENLRFRDGEASTRLGVSKLAWLNNAFCVTAYAPWSATPGDMPSVNPVGQGYGAGVFKDPNSFEWILIAADGGIFRHKAHNARVQLSLPTGVAIKSRVTFTQAFDKVFCFRGRHLATLVMRSIDDGFVDLVDHWSGVKQYAANDEVAFGPWQPVATLTRVGLLVTATFATPHGYVSGADLVVRGANQAEFNGRFNITVLDDQTLTYYFSGSATATATGTISVSNQANHFRAIASVSESKTLLSLTSSGTVATATYATAHGYDNGASVTFQGAVQSGYNGTFVVTVTGDTTLTYVLAATTTSPATGTITSFQSYPFPAIGDSPESAPSKWHQIYTILPNADEGLYIQNLLLVPTAWTPGGNDYSVSGSYLKKDFLVCTDVLDQIHFQFTNEFRINAGSADEIVALCKFSNDQVIITKGTSWGILSGLSGGVANASLDWRGESYGACAPSSMVLAGSVPMWVAGKRGVVSLFETEQGKLQSEDAPFSNDIEDYVNRVNWVAGNQVRMAYWDDKLFVAVPLDGAVTNNAMLVYDFRAKAWAGIDTGKAICPQEFFQATYNGVQRLFFLGTDGFVSMVEEMGTGDEVGDLNSPLRLGFEPIATKFVSRGYAANSQSSKAWKRTKLVLATANACWSVGVNTSSAGSFKALKANVTRNPLKRLRPFDAPAYDPSNCSGDFNAPNRSDYTLKLPPGGMVLGGGVFLGWFQEFTETFSVRPAAGRYLQLTITNAQGRMKIKSIGPTGVEGQRREGTL